MYCVTPVPIAGGIEEDDITPLDVARCLAELLQYTQTQPHLNIAFQVDYLPCTEVVSDNPFEQMLPLQPILEGTTHILSLKEVAFTVFNKCRRVSAPHLLTRPPKKNPRVTIPSYIPRHLTEYTRDVIGFLSQYLFYRVLCGDDPLQQSQPALTQPYYSLLSDNQIGTNLLFQPQVISPPNLPSLQKNTLHCSYCVAPEGDFLLCALTDGRGEMLYTPHISYQTADPSHALSSLYKRCLSATYVTMSYQAVLCYCLSGNRCPMPGAL